MAIIPGAKEDRTGVCAIDEATNNQRLPPFFAFLALTGRFTGSSSLQQVVSHFSFHKTW